MKISAFCDDSSTLPTPYLFTGLSVMSDASDSQNRSESPIADIPEAGTSHEKSISDDGERSTPSGMPPATTRTRKHRNSSSKDEDFVVEEVTSKPKRKVVAKEQQG